MARIGLHQNVSMRGEQQMLLLPRMLQSIEVLQLPSLELEGWLREAAEGNEALSVDGAERGEHIAERRGTQADTDAHDEMLRNHPDRGQTLCEVVEEQLVTLELSDELEEWLRFLIGCMDDSGYLSASDERLLELAVECDLAPDPGQLGQAIAALQQLEPRGLGARSAVEAMLLQIDPGDPDYSHLCALLEDFLEDLARNKLPSVASALGVDLDQLGRLLESLRELDPRPTAHLVEHGAPVIQPDVIVDVGENGDFEVRLTKGSLPSVRVDADVKSLAKDPGQEAEVRKYLRGKLDQARWIVDAIEQRGRTILRISQSVFAHQHEFLAKGQGHLVPLRMNQLADKLDLHVSTVSRAVNAKYVQTTWGIFPLRLFFQAGAGAAEEGGEGAARDGVRGLIKEIIETEDSAAPMSDDDVVRELGKRDLKIARRTVAKYRGELGIPSSYRRRRYSD